MHASPSVALRLTSMVALALAVLAGCGKDKTTGPVVTPPKYPVLSSPKNVLTALRTAYVTRDSLEIPFLYDDAYVGTTIDPYSPSPYDSIGFTKADEVAHVAALARKNVLVDMTLNAANGFRDGTDPPGWMTIQNPISNLDIADNPTEYIVGLGGEAMDFKFVPHTPDPSSPTDTTWKIIQWTEVRTFVVP